MPPLLVLDRATLVKLMKHDDNDTAVYDIAS